ncbi:LysR family transcriptional regulator [Citricoccus sp. NR2]|uniref:LysR family transcriptional regulator n=1 Tax=Citricoccus sp. NR2 TaxID=3004095 RepID=UPI0022DD2813|nr:LysR family transcriptional regulator [Citricoccus sp. NR2]WBL19539.1 LysR family transcriptional regulator [Citricoccus sp. NR2]
MAEITVRQLEYFLAVVDYGSISASARHLHVSQAAVSMAIQQLEKSLNASLMTRSPSRRATPTAAGEALIPRARIAMRAIQEAADAVHDDRQSMRGTLRLAVTSTISPHVIPPLVKHFQTHYPDVFIDVTEKDQDTIQDMVRKGQADLGIVYLLSLHPDLPHVTLETVRQHVVIPSTHRLAHRESIRLEEIIEEPLIPVNVPPSIERITDSIRSLGLQPLMRWPSQNYETVRSMVSHGLGWSYFNLVPQSTVSYDGGTLKYIPIADPMPKNEILGVTQPGVEFNSKVSSAIEFIQDKASAPLDETM